MIIMRSVWVSMISDPFSVSMRFPCPSRRAVSVRHLHRRHGDTGVSVRREVALLGLQGSRGHDVSAARSSLGAGAQTIQKAPTNVHQENPSNDRLPFGDQSRTAQIRDFWWSV